MPTTASEATALNDSILDPVLLKELAQEITDVMFDNGEMSVLEKKVEDQLLELVSRIFHRLEEFPEQRRDAEEALMSIEAPDLALAMLRQAFLVRTAETEETVVSHLVRLAQSNDRKRAQLSREALTEATYSEMPRLQNIGAQALFKTHTLMPKALLEFSRAHRLGFQHRMSAANELIHLQASEAVPAFIELVRAWAEMPEKIQGRHSRTLNEVAAKFKAFESAEEERAKQVVIDLFEAVDDRRLAKTAKKLFQNALASIGRHTLIFFEQISIQDIRSPGAIFTLGTCARRSSEATKLLLEWFEALAGEDSDSNSRAIEYIFQQLKRAKVDRNPTILAALEDLIERARQPEFAFEFEAYATQLEDLKTTWSGNSGQLSFMQQMKDLVQEYEEFGRAESDTLFTLKISFERERTKPEFERLSREQRNVMMDVIRETSAKSPWTNHYTWLLAAYPHAKGEERLVVLDALGAVAVLHQSTTENKTFRTLRDFFLRRLADGDGADRQRAAVWLDQIGVGTKLPGSR